MLKRGCAALALAAVWIAPAFAEPTGLWLDKDGWTIRIQACGPDLCAVIASVKPPLKPTNEREFRTAARRPKFSALSNAKMETLGIEPMPPLDQAIGLYLMSRNRRVVVAPSGEAAPRA
jgi:hypothetical protein